MGGFLIFLLSPPVPLFTPTLSVFSRNSPLWLQVPSPRSVSLESPVFVFVFRVSSLLRLSSLGVPHSQGSKSPTSWTNEQLEVLFFKEERLRMNPSLTLKALANTSVIPNGAKADARLLPSNDIDSFMGEEIPHPTLTLIPCSSETDDISIRTWCASMHLPNPMRVWYSLLSFSLFPPPPLISGYIYVVFRDWADYNLANLPSNSRKWNSMGTIYCPPGYDPLHAVASTYFVYFSGQAIHSPVTRDRFKKHLMGKGINVAEVKLSSKCTFLVVVLRSLTDLHKITSGEFDSVSLLPQKGNNPTHLSSPSHPSPLVPLFFLFPFFPLSPLFSCIPSESELASVFVLKPALTVTGDPYIRPIKVERVSPHADGRLLLGFKQIAPTQDKVNPDNIVCFSPQTKKGSSENTPYGILWVNSTAACEYFLRHAVIKVRSILLVFKVPEYIPPSSPPFCSLLLLSLLTFCFDPSHLSLKISAPQFSLAILFPFVFVLLKK